MRPEVFIDVGATMVCTRCCFSFMGSNRCPFEPNEVCHDYFRELCALTALSLASLTRIGRSTRLDDLWFPEKANVVRDDQRRREGQLEQKQIW